MAYSTRISQEENTPVVWLEDDTRDIRVAVSPSHGNRTIRLLVRGENILHFPFENAAAAKQDRSTNGIPFLAPWANRMDGGGFRANGREYRFNDATGTLRKDGNGLPIHGMLTASPLWDVTAVGADDAKASLTSRFEFWKHPPLMANWPFAHAYSMIYTLEDGALNVRLTIQNLSAEPMPVSIGFHPYFRLPGVARQELSLRLPVSRHVETDTRLVPTGEFRDVSFPPLLGLDGQRFDDGYIGIAPPGLFSIAGGGKAIDVEFGPKFTVAVIYAPPDHDFVCFEPMTAITNGVNLAAEGKYEGLQQVPAGGEWSESFRITPRGW